MADDLWTLDACDIADRVRSRELSAAEVLDVFLDRIDGHNASLNAFVHVDRDRARAEAKAVDDSKHQGLLAGVPVGIKDLEDVDGMPTQLGSVPYKGTMARRDAVHVRRLRDAGAVIVGKTATPEFGSTAYTSTPLHGITRNPWNLERTPGGSSGGSAAAVIAGLVPVASGSDGGGSIRIPASYSGLVGPKGTFGRIPRGSGPDSSYTSHLGPMARSVRDAARWFDVTMGSHESDQFSLPRPAFDYEGVIDNPPAGLRAAWSDDLGFGACSAEVARIAREAADALGVEWVDRTVDLQDPAMAWMLLGKPAGWLSVESFWPERESDLTPTVAAGVRLGLERYNVTELAKAAKVRWHNNQVLAEVFDDVDVIVTPTTATTAFAADGPMPSEVDGRRMSPMHAITFTYPFNISGHPGVSVPCGFDSQGLPVGLQIVTRRHADHTALQLARAFERARPWPRLAPAYA